MRAVGHKFLSRGHIQTGERLEKQRRLSSECGLSLDFLGYNIELGSWFIGKQTLIYWERHAWIYGEVTLASFYILGKNTIGHIGSHQPGYMARRSFDIWE